MVGPCPLEALVQVRILVAQPTLSSTLGTFALRSPGRRFSDAARPENASGSALPALVSLKLKPHQRQPALEGIDMEASSVIEARSSGRAKSEAGSCRTRRVAAEKPVVAEKPAEKKRARRLSEDKQFKLVFWDGEQTAGGRDCAAYWG